MSNISIKIDLTKIDKSKIYNGKNGAKYITLDVMERRDGVDQYGNSHFVKQEQTRDERLSKVKPNYVGDGKVIDFGKGGGGGQQTKTQSNDDLDW